MLSVLSFSVFKCRFVSLLSIVLATVLASTTVHSSDLQKTLIMNVNIVDVIKGRVLENQDIFIDGDRIVLISSNNKSLKAQAGILINLPEHYVIPGLFDMHVHLATNPSGFYDIEQTKRQLAFLLKHGVTGIRDMAGDIRALSYLNRQSLTDEIASPNIFYSALFAGESFFSDPRTHSSTMGLTPGNVPWMQSVNEDSDIKNLINKALGSGVSGIKLYGDLTQTQVKSVIKQASEMNVPVWGHAAVIPAKPHELVDAGITSVSHSALLAWSTTAKNPQDAKERYTDFEIDITHPTFLDMLKKMAANNVYLDATISTFKNHKTEFVYNNGIKAAKAAHQAGVPFVVGTDNTYNFWKSFPSVYDEMISLNQDIGLSEMEVIQAATINAARLMKVDAEVGSIEIGKKADLVILKENPLTNIEAMKSAVLTFKNGKSHGK